MRKKTYTVMKNNDKFVIASDSILSPRTLYYIDGGWGTNTLSRWAIEMDKGAQYETIQEAEHVIETYNKSQPVPGMPDGYVLY